LDANSGVRRGGGCSELLAMALITRGAQLDAIVDLAMSAGRSATRPHPMDGCFCFPCSARMAWNHHGWHRLELVALKKCISTPASRGRISMIPVPCSHPSNANGMIQNRTTMIVVQNASRCRGDKTRHDKKEKVYLKSIDATQKNDPVIPFAFPASDPFINA